MGQARTAEQAFSNDEMRRLARARLPRMVFDFIDGGAEEETTRDLNESEFRRLLFRPTPLNGTGERDPSVELFGERLATPVIISPTGLSGMVWPNGEIEAARAAHAAGTVYCLSHGSTLSIEDVAAAAPGRNWFQVFMYRNRGLTQSMTERAQAAGYGALILTTDNQVLGQRERDLRNGFVIPPRPSIRGALDLLSSFRWLVHMRDARKITLANYARSKDDTIASLGRQVAEWLDPGACWRDVAWLRTLWKGPLLLKGILHPDEARAALDHGVDGVIVSNHGGRQLDGALPAIRALPAVVDAVQGRIPVLIDGGMRRGGDVVRALALGARACLIGRPHLFGLAVAGEAGVARVLELYRTEIDRVLALGGWDGIAALSRDVLEIPPGFAACADLERRSPPQRVAAVGT